MALDEDMTLERYRYISSRISACNDISFKVVTLFIGVAGLIISALVTIGLTYSSLRVAAVQAVAYSYTLLYLLTLLTVVAVVLMIINALHWYRYREEECQVLQTQGIARQAPRWTDAYRWMETYLAATMVATAGAAWLIATLQVIPTIQ